MKLNAQKVEEYIKYEKYFELVKETTKFAHEPIFSIHRNRSKMIEYWFIYKNSFFAASELHLYDEMLKFGEKLLKFPFFIDIRYEDVKNKIAILERLLEANIYRLVSCHDSNENKIESIILMLNAINETYGISPTNFFKDLELIYNNYTKGILPYYELEAFIPFNLPFNSFKTKVGFINNLKEISFEKITRNEDTQYELYYTRIRIHIYGFIYAKSDWCGASVECFQKNYLQNKFTEIVNDVLLCVSIIDNNNYYPRVYDQYLQTFISTQMIDKENQFNYCNFTNFGNGPIINNRKASFSEKDMNDLEELLNDKQFALYKKLIVLCKNDLSVGLYTEAFFLINSALEAMVYHFAKQIMVKINKEDFYNQFLKGSSPCEECEYRKEKNGKNRIDENYPTLFKTIRFLKKQLSLTKKECENLLDLVKSIRCDHIRNDLVHGRIDIVKIEIVNEALNKLNVLEKELIKILNHINK